MSGRKDKESRRMQVKIDKLIKQGHMEVEAERNALTPLVLNQYHKKLNELSFYKRFKISWKILWKIT